MSCTRGKGRPEWEQVRLWLAISLSPGWDFYWGPRITSTQHSTKGFHTASHLNLTVPWGGGTLDKGYYPQDSQHNWEFQGVESTFFTEDGLAPGRLLTAVFLCGSSKPGGWAYRSIRDQLLILSTHSTRSTLRNEHGGLFVSHSETFRSLNKVFKAPFDHSLPSSASSFSVMLYTPSSRMRTSLPWGLHYPSSPFLLFISEPCFPGGWDLGSTSGLGQSPGIGNDYPLQYSGRENSMGKGTWQATVHGVAKRRAEGLPLGTDSSLCLKYSSRFC